jgi:hypothetical protein
MVMMLLRHCGWLLLVTSPVAVNSDDGCPPNSHANPATQGCDCDAGFHVNAAGAACVAGCPIHSHDDPSAAGCVCDVGYAIDKTRQVCVKALPCTSRDRGALLEAFVIGPQERGVWNALVAGWRNDTEPCGTDGSGGWFGVVCVNGRVEQINLYSLPAHAHLGLQLGPAIGRLSKLTKLIFVGTQLSGTVPPQISALKSLAQLGLGSTMISGTLPSSMGRLSRMQLLSLDTTSLSGTLPAEMIGNMTELQVVAALNTSISGTLPWQLGGLSKLSSFSMQHTPISGSLPSPLGSRGLSSLSLWQTYSTLIDGSIPDGFGVLPALKSLVLVHTRISGSMPAFANYTALELLFVSETSLSGTLPANMNQMSALSEVHFESTTISGSIPEIGGLSRLASLSLYQTLISGTVPCSLGSLASLEFLELHTTVLSGTLPAFSGTKRLMTMNLHSTKISGYLQHQLDDLDELQFVSFRFSSVSGTVPQFSGCNKLFEINLGECAITALPAALPSSVTHLYLNNNPLNTTGDDLRSLLATLPNLHVLDVGFTNLPIVLTDTIVGNEHNQIGGTHIAAPTECHVGSVCVFRLYMYDLQTRPVHVGELLSNITMRLGNRTTMMADERNGSFVAQMPLSWITRSGVHAFQFFHYDTEITPRINEYGSHPQSDDCNKLVRGCPSLRTVRFLPRICPHLSNTVPDSTGGVCICQPGFEVSHSATVASSYLICRRSCSGGRVERDNICECPTYDYDNELYGIVLCESSDWTPVGRRADFQSATNSIASGQKCTLCPECATCRNGDITLQQGWRLNSSSDEEISNLKRNSGPTSVQVAFRCLAALAADSACPPLSLRAKANVSACSGQHTGRLCASCKPNFWLDRKSDSCRQCGKDSNIRVRYGLPSWAFLLLVLLSPLPLVGIAAAQRKRIRRFKSDAFTNVKIVLGLAQVLSLLQGVLDIALPPNTQTTLGYMGLLTLDVRSLLQLECNNVSWFGKFVLTTIGLPLLAFVLVGCRWTWQRTRASTENMVQNAETTAISSLFFVTMLLYPRVSTSILSVFRCRQLGPDLSVLEEDYAVDCGADSDMSQNRYLRYRVVAIVLLLTWTFGIPLGPLFLVLRQSRQASSVWNSTGGQVVTRSLEESRASSVVRQSQSQGRYASYSSAGMIVELNPNTPEHEDIDTVESAKELYCTTQMHETYSFCVSDFRPECFWFEPIDMLRKLLLSGLLQFWHRGTAQQILVGCGLSFAACGLQLYLCPYREPEANTLKALADAQIFVVFLISFMLRVLPFVQMDSREPGTTVEYGHVLLASFAFFAIAALFLTTLLVYRHRRFRHQLTASIENEFESGVFELALVGSSSHSRHTGGSTLDVLASQFSTTGVNPAHQQSDADHTSTSRLESQTGAS